jgi:hypothetical protein
MEKVRSDECGHLEGWTASRSSSLRNVVDALLHPSYNVA